MIQLYLNWTAFRNAIAAGKTDCKIKFASQMWAARPRLANIFKKLLDQKTFICLRLSICSQCSKNSLFLYIVSRETWFLEKPTARDSARLGHIPSLPWESQLPLKPYLSLQPSDFEGNCDSLRFSLRFLFSFIVQFLFASQMWAARPHLANIFKKLLDQKTFVCLRLVIGKPDS